MNLLKLKVYFNKVKLKQIIIKQPLVYLYFEYMLKRDGMSMQLFRNCDISQLGTITQYEYNFIAGKVEVNCL